MTVARHYIMHAKAGEAAALQTAQTPSARSSTTPSPMPRTIASPKRSPAVASRAACTWRRESSCILPSTCASAPPRSPMASWPASPRRSSGASVPVLPMMVGPQGFEPWTEGLKVLCSTAELRAHVTVFQIERRGVYAAHDGANARGGPAAMLPALLLGRGLGTRRVGYFSVCQVQRGETP